MKTNYTRYVKIPLLFFAAVVLVGTVLSSCSLDRWVDVEHGEYVFIQARGGLSQLGMTGLSHLDIDRQESLARLGLVDGTEILASFMPRAKAEWPSGCPANIQSTRMEVLDLEMETLTIGSITLRNPVLVRDCPRNPVEVVLREDGDIGGGGNACKFQDLCLIFGRE